MTVTGVMSTQDAVTRIAEDLLDDANQRRWSDTQIMRALRTALDKCVVDYLQGGGTRLMRVDSLTTDANGQVALEGNAQPERVLWVVRVENSIREELEPIPYKDAILFDDQSGVTVEVMYPAVDPLSSLTPGATKLLTYNTTNALISPEGGFPAMEDWIVKRAAAELAVKDIARYQVLQSVALEARNVCIGTLPTVASGGFDGAQRFSRSYKYCWNGAKIQLVRWA